MNSITNIWLKSNKISSKSKDFILKMSKAEIEDAFVNEKMKFGTAGIRQIMGPGTNRMNAFTYQQMAHGYAQYILSKKTNNDVRKVIIGHDNRANADMFALVCANVLSSFGISVTLFNDNQLMPTPIISFCIKHYGYDGGIIVTASHNPKNYLGFKAYNSTGGQIQNEDAEFIREHMPESDTILHNEYAVDESLINYFDDSVIDDYYEATKSCLIKTNVNEKKIFPIVFTSHHGTASYLMPDYLRRLGYSNVVTVKQQCVPDPNFTYSSTSNPEDPASFELAEKYAQSVSAEIMLGVDPDADRLAVAVLHNGCWRYLTGNEMGIIFTYYVLKNKKFVKHPFIVSTYVSTYLIDKIADHFGATVYRTQTGFKNLGNVIEKKCNHEELVVAFEEAIGSLNSTINRDKDSFQAAALALEIHNEYRKENWTLVDILEQEIFPNFGYWAGGTMSYTFKGLDWQKTMNDKMDFFSNYKVDMIHDVMVTSRKWNSQADALEWQLQEGMWIKFRKSGTEPKFKIYFNIYGSSFEDANNRYNEIKNIMNDLMRE